MPRKLVLILLTLGMSTLLSLLVMEGAARFYVYQIAERGKLFEADPALGWAPIPDLTLRRLNGEGEPWLIETTGGGFRTESDNFRDDALHRVLVLGDSFAFGQGVELDQRFDSRIAKRHADWSFVNQGVMGYGTDQQLIAARETIELLRPNDILLLVTYINDFSDLLRKQHSQRSKPWFELVDGALVEHPPKVGLAERLREGSYLFARFFALFAHPVAEFSDEEMNESGRIHQALVLSETRAAVSRGVTVIIAHHLVTPTQSSAVRHLSEIAAASLAQTCHEDGIHCMSLDGVLPVAQDDLFQSDGHWTAKGHAAVSGQIEPELERRLSASANGD